MGRLGGDVAKSSLPLILQSAVTLMEWTEALSAFHGHPHIADILLARRVAREPDARSRGMAIAAMGISRFMEALRSKPVQEDASGRLFQIGRPEDPSTFVEVRDRVFGPHGRPVRHWISVPPHVATAHEAIAWTFGMTAAEYRPTRKT